MILSIDPSMWERDWAHNMKVIVFLMSIIAISSTVDKNNILIF